MFTMPTVATLPVSRRLQAPVAGGTDTGRFTGTLLVQRFAAQDGALIAMALVTGTLTNSTGVMSMARTLRVPATVLEANAESVQFDFGCLSLEILWWRIELGHVVVDAASEDGLPLAMLDAHPGSVASEPANLARLLNTMLDLSC